MSLHMKKIDYPPSRCQALKAKKFKLPGLPSAGGRFATARYCALIEALGLGAGFMASEEVSIARAFIYGHACMDARLQGRRAFGELSSSAELAEDRAVVEPRRERRPRNPPLPSFRRRPESSGLDDTFPPASRREWQL